MNAAQGKERMEEDQIVLEGENGEKLVFYVLEQTRIAGKSYLLVTDSRDGDAEAFILRDDSEDTDKESVYVFVEDDAEFEAISGVFEGMLDE